MNEKIIKLEKKLTWDIITWEKTDSEAATPKELSNNQISWNEYKVPQSFYKNKIWFRGKFKKSKEDIFADGFELKIIADDSAYLWYGELENFFFAYETLINIPAISFSSENFLYLNVIKTAGLPRIIDLQVTPLSIKQELDEIRDFVLGIKSAYKLLSFDTYQSNARLKIDPGLDKTNIRKQERNELKRLLDSVVSKLPEIKTLKDYNFFRSRLSSIKSELKPIEEFTKTFALTFASNAHIDAAWLWRANETKQVCKTTFSAVNKMMKKRKDFTYTQSSAIFYKWIENEDNKLFQKIKKRINEGRWEVIGGSWLEPDCNLISGESWIEQIRMGKEYFKEKFGIDETVAFNPDSFGYNANLPMIYKKAGLDTFFTQKIGWNEKTVFPHRIFLWESKDGSRILSYFPFDYVDLISDPFKFVDWLRQFEANTGCKNLLILFGVGDHGGGPTTEMFKKIDRLKSIIGFPKIKFDSIKNYLINLKKIINEDDLPIWKDELYLEYHQGTYTTQAVLKRYNRQLESNISALEKLNFISVVLQKSIADSLDEIWERILFNQFHDILPGSSIREVVLDAIEDYKYCESVIKNKTEFALRQLIKSPQNLDGNYLTLFNPFNWKASFVIELNSAKDLTSVIDMANESQSKAQRSEYPKESSYFIAKNIPAFGYKTYKLIHDEKANKSQLKRSFSKNFSTLENRYFKIKFDKTNGCLKKVVDKKNKRIISTNNLNTLLLIDDKPKDWDAWNIDLNGKEYKPKFENFEFVEDGPVRKVIRFYFSFFHPDKTKSFPTKDFPTSFFEQDIILYNNLNRIDFETRVDWWEERMLLKVLFPIKIKKPKLHYEIPFGYIERKEPGENKFEKAKTEVPALRWVDISDHDFGISIINNSKHGFDFNDNALRMSLLRSPIWPDPTADRGKHVIRFSLITHKNPEDKSELFRRAYEFNTEIPKIFHKKKLSKESSFLKLPQKNVILSSIKAVGNSSNTFVFHCFETKGKNTVVKLELPRKPHSAYKSNIMYEKIEKLRSDGKVLEFDIKAHSIASVLVKF